MTTIIRHKVKQPHAELNPSCGG